MRQSRNFKFQISEFQIEKLFENCGGVGRKKFIIHNSKFLIAI